MRDIKKASLKLWDILLCVVKTSKRAPFKTKAKVRVGWSEPTFSLGRHHCSQPVTRCPALAGCPLCLAQQPLSPLRWCCRRQQWLLSHGSLKGGSGRWWGAVRPKQCSSSIRAASSEPSTWAVLCFTSPPPVSVNLVWTGGGAAVWGVH